MKQDDGTPTTPVLDEEFGFICGRDVLHGVFAPLVMGLTIVNKGFPASVDLKDYRQTGRRCMFDNAQNRQFSFKHAPSKQRAAVRSRA